MTTQTLTLTDFLLARIAEDEAVARAAIDIGKPGTHWQWVTNETDTPVVPGEELQAIQEQNIGLRTVEEFGSYNLPAFIVYSEDGSGRPESLQHIARHDPARVLAECAAKRAIVERFDTSDDIVLYPVVAALAGIYADHPDYRIEWAG